MLELIQDILSFFRWSSKLLYKKYIGSLEKFVLFKSQGLSSKFPSTYFLCAGSYINTHTVFYVFPYEEFKIGFFIGH